MDAMEKISNAKRRLMVKSPFWSVLVLNTPLELTDAVPTAATDGRRIMVNPKFLASLPGGQVEFLLAHEAAHIMFLHAVRVGHRLPRVWNMAADYVINHLLTEDGMTFIEGVLLDARYTTTAEQVYDQLIADAEDDKGEGEGEGGIGHDLMPSDMPEAEAQVHAQKVRQLVAQAATVARMAGKMGAELERLVGTVLTSTVPWPALLRDALQTVVRDDEAWSRRNRRMADVYLPGRYSLRLESICIIVDTSGSIGAEELSQALAEIRAVAEQTQPETLRVLAADIRVVSDEEVDWDSPLNLTFDGGGGTDMRVPLEHVEQYNPAAVVLITDGYTPWPTSEPPYNLIVCCTTDVEVPIGRIVRLR